MRRILPLIAILTFGAAGCAAEMEEVPETAEVEAEPMEADIELIEEWTLSPEDIGQTVMATGWQAGTLVEEGFFLRTENDRLLFVETDDLVPTEGVVQVLGTVQATEEMVFEVWEAEAFDAEIDATWDLETTYYIANAAVEPM